MARSWFYDLKHQPPPTILADLASYFEADQVTERETGSLGPSSDYESLTVRCQPDGVRVSIGHELLDPSQGEEWWILVEAFPWWRQPWNLLPARIIPYIEQYIEQDENTSTGWRV